MKNKVKLNELQDEKNDFAKTLDDILNDLGSVAKKLEHAHQLAPAGTAKAIVAGLHSDQFNQVAEFRKYVAQLKKLSTGTTKAEGAKLTLKQLRKLIAEEVFTMKSLAGGDPGWEQDDTITMKSIAHDKTRCDLCDRVMKKTGNVPELCYQCDEDTKAVMNDK